MKPPVPGSSISGEITADPNPSTGFMTITATDTDPVRAAEVANAFGEALGINEHAETSKGSMRRSVSYASSWLICPPPTPRMPSCLSS